MCLWFSLSSFLFRVRGRAWVSVFISWMFDISSHSYWRDFPFCREHFWHLYCRSVSYRCTNSFLLPVPLCLVLSAITIMTSVICSLLCHYVRNCYASTINFRHKCFGFLWSCFLTSFRFFSSTAKESIIGILWRLCLNIFWVMWTF